MASKLVPKFIALSLIAIDTTLLLARIETASAASTFVTANVYSSLISLKAPLTLNNCASVKLIGLVSITVILEIVAPPEIRACNESNFNEMFAEVSLIAIDATWLLLRTFPALVATTFETAKV